MALFRKIKKKIGEAKLLVSSGGYKLTKKKLNKNFQRIQDGKILPADPKAMRIMSKILKKKGYGTTQTPNDPQKIDLNAEGPALRRICTHPGKKTSQEKTKEKEP